MKVLAGIRCLFPPWCNGCGKELKEINVKVSEIAGAVQEIKDKMAEALAEIPAKIAELNETIVRLSEQLADADVPAEAEATLADAKGQAQALADVVQ